ncbi:MAG: EamA family transporter [Rhodospirillaceae bacterium]|nr:EamA family transporter [Rhodospirillaceae bacterium]
MIDSIDAWVLITLAASVVQTLRSVLQKNMTARLSVAGTTYARFFYGFPVAIAFVIAAASVTGLNLPTPSGQFFFYAAVGGLGQVIGNLLFFGMLSFTNFTIGTTYAKTETVLAALLSFFVLGDVLSPLGLAGVLITFLGVWVMAAGRGKFALADLLRAAVNRAAVQGVAIGLVYAVASTFYRAAILSLGEGAANEGLTIGFHSLYTLAWVSVFQVTVMSAWLGWRSPSVIREVVRAWRPALWIGIVGVGTSALWYTAFGLQKAAYVLAVGQVELIFAYLASHYLYKERATAIEIAGILVTVAGILAVVLAET